MCLSIKACKPVLAVIQNQIIMIVLSRMSQ